MDLLTSTTWIITNDYIDVIIIIYPKQKINMIVFIARPYKYRIYKQELTDCHLVVYLFHHEVSQSDSSIHSFVHEVSHNLPEKII